MSEHTELNKDEVTWGFIYGVLFVFKIYWIALCIAPLCSWFWAISGAGSSKLYRRLGVPLLTSIPSAIVLQSFQPLWSIPLAFAVLSLGYGIPDSTDSGSLLGMIFKKEWIVRGIIILLLIIANLPTILCQAR